jgi:hypothetical protein
MSDTEQERLAWRPSDWLKAAGHPFSRAKLYAEIGKGRIDARSADRVTLITTSPAAYIASLPRGVGPAFGRGRRRKAAAGA